MKYTVAETQRGGRRGDFGFITKADANLSVYSR